jgi:hypothetical protein
VLRLWSTVRAPAALLLIAIAFSFAGANVVRGRFAMGDFKAFYCSAKVTLAREDPYSAAPLARCEAIGAPAPLFVTNFPQVLPAPLPGYAIAAFVPFALLPFPAACVAWLVALLAATIAAIMLLSRTGLGDPWDLAIALTLLVVATSFPMGELPPVALFGIALCAWAVKHDRVWLVGIGIALSLFEPQIGAAVALCAIALGRRFAVAAVAALLALGVLSIAAVGIAGDLEYLRVVVPAHVLAELPSVLQYSLSWALFRLGMAPPLAMLLGRLSWVAMLCVSVWFARSPLARRRPEAALLAAPAFAVVGGPFLHLDQIALAVPAAVWLSVRSERAQWLRTAALIALCVPLLYVFSIIRLAAMLPLFAAWLGGAYGRSAIAGLRAALAAIVIAAGIAAIAVAAGTGSAAIAPLQTLPSTLPQASWSAFVAAHYAMTGWSVWLVKAPMCFGILATAAGLVAAARSTAS